MGLPLAHRNPAFGAKGELKVNLEPRTHRGPDLTGPNASIALRRAKPKRCAMDRAVRKIMLAIVELLIVRQFLGSL
jgi:hypothetical protein